jgi:hypothetical protein
MAEVKKVMVFGPGRTKSVEAEIIPGETAKQLLVLVVPQLGLPERGGYQLIGSDGNTITDDVYKAVKDGDELRIGRMDEGA